MILRNNINWVATGTKENKGKLLSLLVRNGVKGFDSRKTARFILKGGNYIKGIDYNRKGERGNFFISTDTMPENVFCIDLDLIVDWTVNIDFILGND